MGTVTSKPSGMGGSGQRPLSSEDVKPVAEQNLREMWSDVAKHGPGYATRYVQYLTGERSTYPMPKGLHPSVAAAIRDTVTDACLVAGVKTVRVFR